MLSDTQILDAIRWRGLVISGFNTDCLQPASYDVHLHPQLLVLRDGAALDPKVDTAGEWSGVEIPDAGLVLGPRQFALGSTLERLNLGSQLMGQLEGKSSLGRLGLFVHSTAGYLDPGFAGQVTLELGCAQSRGIVLYPGMPIGQVAFMRCAAVGKPYQGKYTHQHGPTPSRFHLNWDGMQWVA